MIEIKMPRLSDSMVEGVVLQWLKSEGDNVNRGDDLVEIETDKATMVYQADASGILLSIVAQAGENLPIGAVLGLIGERGEHAGKVPDRAEGHEEARQPATIPARETSMDHAGSSAAPLGEATAPVRSPMAERELKASPVARRLAAANGLELREIRGSGPGGRIVKGDVERALSALPGERRATESPSPTTRPSESEQEHAKGSTAVVELTSLQRTVAKRMAEATTTVPHFCASAEVEMSSAAHARRQLKRTLGDGALVPSLNDLVVKAAALALREQPRVNAAYVDGRYEFYSRINVGVAVSAEGALLVPTVFDADIKGLREITQDTRRLSRRVHEGSVTPAELAGGTFTVSNLGMLGVQHFAAVINPPQAAILAVGALTERPLARDGRVECAEMATLTLSCDHRILYGADAAHFLGRVKELLEEPLALAL
jgi:pyruvate dehydrogenase E2 component (dihydrolipoamide acetyltransferase)